MSSPLIRKIITVLLCVLFIAAVPVLSQQGAAHFYWSLFIKGKLQGNLSISAEGTSFVTSGDSCHLVLGQPGKSVLRYVFALDTVPGEYYILNDWKSFPRKAIVKINVNGRELSTIQIGCAKYISQGFEIAQLLQKGENTIEMTLMPGGENLWVRGTILTENPSLARNVELLPDLLPSYARTCALILLVLGLLYLIWFFMNRTLYRNMDTYSASFALIGVMITSLGVAYCMLLVTRMMSTSIVFLAATVILALLAMVSVKRNDPGKSAASGNESSEEEKVSGSDFNF